MSQKFSAVDEVEIDEGSPFLGYLEDAEQILDRVSKSKPDGMVVELGDVLKELSDVFSQASLPKKMTKLLFGGFCVLYEQLLGALGCEQVKPRTRVTQAWACFTNILKFANRVIGVDESNGMRCIGKISDVPSFVVVVEKLKDAVATRDEAAVDQALAELEASEAVKGAGDQKMVEVAVSDVRNSVLLRNALVHVLKYVSSSSVLVTDGNRGDLVDAVEMFGLAFARVCSEQNGAAVAVEHSLKCVKGKVQSDALRALIDLRRLVGEQKGSTCDDYALFEAMLMKSHVDDDVIKLRKYEGLRRKLQINYCSTSELCELLVLFSECLSIRGCGQESVEILEFLSDRLSIIAMSESIEILVDGLHERYKVSNEIPDMKSALDDLIQRTADVAETDMLVPELNEFLRRLIVFLKINRFVYDSPTPGGKEQKILFFPVIKKEFPRLFDDAKVPMEILNTDDFHQRNEYLRNEIRRCSNEHDITNIVQWKMCIDFEHSLDSFMRTHAVTSESPILRQPSNFSRALYECFTTVLSVTDIIQWQQTQRLWLDMSLSLIYVEYSTPDVIRPRWVEMMHTIPVPTLDFSVQSVLRLLELSITHKEAPGLYSMFVDHLMSGSRDKWDKLRKMMNILPELEQYALATDAMNNICDQIGKMNREFFQVDADFCKVHSMNLLSTFLRSVYRSLYYAVANSLLSSGTTMRAQALLNGFDNTASITRGSIVPAELIETIREVLFLEIEPDPDAFLDYLDFNLASVSLYSDARLTQLGIYKEISQIQEIVAVPCEGELFRSDVMAILELLVRLRKKLSLLHSTEAVVIREAVSKAFKSTIAYANILSLSQDVKILLFLVLSFDGTSYQGFSEELSKVCAEPTRASSAFEDSFDTLCKTAEQKMQELDMDTSTIKSIRKIASRCFMSWSSTEEEESVPEMVCEYIDESLELIDRRLSSRESEAESRISLLEQYELPIPDPESPEYQEQVAEEERHSKELDAELEAAYAELKSFEDQPVEDDSDSALSSLLASINAGDESNLSELDELTLQLANLSSFNDHLEQQIAMTRTSRKVYRDDRAGEFEELLKSYKAISSGQHPDPGPSMLDLVSMVHIPTQIYDTLSQKVPILSREDFFSRCDVIEKFAFELVEEYRVLLELEQQKRGELEKALSRNIPKLEQISATLASLDH